MHCCCIKSPSTRECSTKDQRLVKYITIIMAIVTLVFIMINIFMIRTANGYWWSLGTVSSQVNVNQLSLANQIQALSTKQQRLLDRHPDLIPPVAKGAHVAIDECQRQFRNRRWNCSAYSSDSVFGKILNIACRETAFAYSITAAGVSYALTRACSIGSVKGCQCTNSQGIESQEGWVYEGCDDNIQFGDTFSRKFVDSKERGRDFRAAVNLHNNEAGRAIVRNTMTVQCKCHGVSGSCNVKICNRRLAKFRTIGDTLKDKYDTASNVQVIQVKGRRNMKDYIMQPIDKLFKPPTKMDLVYFEKSPSFCDYNLAVGSLGTKGRLCEASSLGIEGCDLLCCRRGWTTKLVETVRSCNCTFHVNEGATMTMGVKCHKCPVTKKISRCK